MNIYLACGHDAVEGSLIFSHYTMLAGTIGTVERDGWFHVADADGSLLNGERCMCIPCAERYWPTQLEESLRALAAPTRSLARPSRQVHIRARVERVLESNTRAGDTGAGRES